MSGDAKAIRVCVLVADGSEEIETCGCYDTCIRAGFDTVLAKVDGPEGDSAISNTLRCTMSRGMHFIADQPFSKIVAQDKSGCLAEFDMVMLPGGSGGAKAFAANKDVVSILKKRKASRRWYAAICASPAIVLLPNGLLPTLSTCYPSLQPALSAQIESGSPSEKALAQRVVVDKASRCVTSQGPGTTLEFATTVVAVLAGGQKASAVAKALLLPAVWCSGLANGDAGLSAL